MAHPALINRSRIPPESVGRDIARLLAPTYACLLEAQLPDTFTAIIRRMETFDDQDVAVRLIELARSGDDGELTWASYEHEAAASRFIDPRWYKKPSVPVRH
jgi:hypothetical protein